jgi:hypothetical protein
MDKFTKRVTSLSKKQNIIEITQKPMIKPQVTKTEKFYYLDSWFDEEFKHKLGSRYTTFKLALNLFKYYKFTNIVETGTVRSHNNYCDGMSTLIFAQFLQKEQINGHIWSVDISIESIAISKQVTSQFMNITHVNSDSIYFLNNFNKNIHLLYLDSYDYTIENIEQCQQHQASELTAAMGHLIKGSIILLDDNNLRGGGKTKLTKELLHTFGAQCLFDDYQSLWRIT